MADSPNLSERRLVLQLLEYWRNLRGERDFPTHEDIDSASISQMWGYCFMLKLADDGNGPVFTYIGDNHNGDNGEELVGRTVSEMASGNLLLANSTNYFEEVVAKKIPITYGGEFVDEEGVDILFRSILLPLSGDGETLDHLFGGANFKLKESS